MRALLSILFILALPQLMVGQESVTLPSRLAKLPNKLPKYEQYALKLTEKYWAAQYHYDTSYIRAIFDTIDIVCIPTLQVKVRRHAKNFHHLPTLLAAARPVKNDSYHLFFNGNRYVGGTEDTPLVSCPGVYGDSLIHTKRGNYHEQLALRISLLSSHHSAAAAQAVADFLNAHPDYPPLLASKILQQADPLFRLYPDTTIEQSYSDK